MEKYKFKGGIVFGAAVTAFALVAGCSSSQKATLREPADFVENQDELSDATGFNAQAKRRFDAIMQRARAASADKRWEINPLHFKDYLARRFINRPDWEKYLGEKAKSGGEVNPAEVYQPAPKTWDQWQAVAENQVAVAARDGVQLNIGMLADWNGDALRGTTQSNVKVGKLKDHRNFGANVTRESALTHDEIKALESIRFPGDRHPALKWIPLYCRDELSEKKPLNGTSLECRGIKTAAELLQPFSAFWKKTQYELNRGELSEGDYPNFWFWYACWPRLSKSEFNQRERSCGMIEYPSPGSALSKLQGILDSIDDHFKRDGQDANGKLVDPIRFAAETQRKFVALHPFNKGNGRVSRWVMDYIMLRHGLPPILVKDMNQDLSTDNDQYVLQARQGVNEALKIMEDCLAKIESGEDVSRGACGSVD
jgi:hypothetical protein